MESLASFRAAHPSLADAIAKCERPDWLISLAWDALPDHKAAVKFGASAAEFVEPDRDFARMFWPVPSRLEVIAAYTGSLDKERSDFDRVRSYTIATPLAALVTYGIACAAHLARHGTRVYSIWFLAIMIALAAVLSPLVRRAIAGLRARRAARLDDAAAFAIVQGILEQGLERRPQVIPAIMKTVGKHVQQVVARELR